MLISQIIREASENRSGYKKIALLPGRFMPPHIGHMKAWQHLRNEFDDAYVVTSDKVDPPRSPFNFQEKKSMFIHAGVPSNRVIQVKNPYHAVEIVSQFDPDTTVAIFGVSAKDMDEDPRFSFKPKKDGSPGFLQPYKPNMGKLQPVSTHAYVTTVPTFKFTVNGQPMRSATEFRANFAQADDSTQAKMVTDLYGKYSDNIHRLMREKIA
jgi:hypothetical protein